MKAENITTANVLDKLRRGGDIPDKELVIAIETLEPVVEFLKVNGDIFFLPAKYLGGKLEQLKGFREARKG
jgi:hypothetical protein